jgi:WD40 repeat protein
MSCCPHCGIEIVESRQEKCPGCGNPLDEGLADGEPERDVTVDLPDATVDLPDEGLADGEPERDVTVDLPDATVDLPDESLTGGKPELDATVGPPDVTIDSTDLDDRTVRPGEKTTAGADSRNLKRIKQIWGTRTTSTAHPNATFKIESHTALGKSSVVIRSRSLRPADQSLDLASASPADYELRDIVGEGGVGIVFSARQSSFNRDVAVKMLRSDRVDDANRNEFVAEAVTTGDLEHPNIIPVHDLGIDEKGDLFYSMKRVQGDPWNKVIKKNTLSENIQIFMKVADAVAFAHAEDVIHRDLKPENVMIGAFGEVLLMDWGLANRFETKANGTTVSQPSSRGGTPAYMAPEMVLDPVEQTGPLADVYLLGAILYEIITGATPHPGKGIGKCLQSVMGNVIRPTDKSGELVDIALRAMRTEPADRFPSVLTLQKAIRDYLSHSESVLLVSRAKEELAAGEKTRDYQHFARAVFGCQEAITLWEGNQPAREVLLAAELAYARVALDKGDYDLALSTLDEEEPSQAELRGEVRAALEERDSRKRRLRNLKRLAVGLTITVFVVVSVAYFEIRKQRNRAEIEQGKAVHAWGVAEQKRLDEEKARGEAESARGLAEEKHREAVKARGEAESARQLAEQRRRDEAKARREAEEAKQVAVEARDEAVAARAAEAYEAYVAEIGLAAARIEANAFDDARRLLEDCRDSEHCHWEWWRLWHLCNQSINTYRAEAPIETVAFDPAGKIAMFGGWDGQIHAYPIGSTSASLTIDHGGYVHAMAVSGDGRLIATGANDKVIRLWHARDGSPAATLEGHEDAILQLAFSRDGRWLLSASYDGTARLWDVASGRELANLQRHNWWVWQAVFSPDGNRIVTASQDGRAIVWRVEDRTDHVACVPVTEFTAHHGPVQSVDFSSRGNLVASGGHDGRILLWNPDEVQPVDLEQRIAGVMESRAPYIELAGHTAPVNCVRFSPDGGRLLSAGDDNVVHIWDVAAGKLIKTLRGHGGRIPSAAFSPDGRSVLSGSHDATARLWSIEGYREVRVLQGHVLRGHDDALLDARFSRDGARIVTASRDRTARTWEVATGRFLHELSEGHEWLATTALFHPDGRRLITSAGDNSVRVWNVATGAELSVLRDTGREGALALSKAGQLTLTGSGDGPAKLFDTESGQLLQTLRLNHESTDGQLAKGARGTAVSALAFSHNDRLVATGNVSGIVQVWRRDEDSSEYRPWHSFDNHSRRVTAAAFLPDGSRLLTASLDNTVAQWDLENGEEMVPLILKHPRGVTSMALVPKQRQLVTACDDGKLRLWQIDEPRLLAEFAGAEGTINSIAVSPAGELALSADATGGKVRLWQLPSGKEIPHPSGDRPDRPLLDFNRIGGQVWTACFTPDGRCVLTVGGNDAQLWDLSTADQVMSFSPHGAVASAAFSPDSRWIVTASWDNSAKIWDTQSGRSLRKLVGGHAGYVNCVAFSPDGSKVLTVGDDRLGRFWDSSSGKLSDVVLSGHGDRIRACAFSPDGRFAATASDDRTARVWDVATGECRLVLEGHDWTVLAVAYSADGVRIATGSEDNRAIIWNATTGEREIVLEGHTAAITATAFSPDGRRILTGSSDQTAKFWDTDTGREVLTLRGHDRAISAVDFSPDGQHVLTASRDGTAILWLSASKTSPDG